MESSEKYTIRILNQDDFEMIYQFLIPHQVFNMHMISNLLHIGILPEYNPEIRFCGLYGGVFQDNKLTAVVCICWNGFILHFSENIDSLNSGIVKLVFDKANRKITGVGGRPKECDEIVRILELDKLEPNLCDEEGLFSLSLNDLTIAEKYKEDKFYFARGTVEEEVDLVAQIRIQFSIESLDSKEDDDLRKNSLDSAKSSHQLKRHFVLVDQNNINNNKFYQNNNSNSNNNDNNNNNTSDNNGNTNIYSFMNFSGVTKTAVHIGPVFTPKEYRCQGHAKRVMYAALQHARDEMKMTHASLIAVDPAAIAVYKSLGFIQVGIAKLILY